MSDFARELFAATVAEPYRTKVVEPLRLPTREDRQRILARSHYSPFYLDASDVYVDLATDSGSGAMSAEQWSALMRGDESYIRSKSFDVLESAVQEITGFRYVVPTHQGRAAENILMQLHLKPGDIVLNNTHFDTTKAHVEQRGALAVDLMSDALWRFDERHPFKGNFDLGKLRVALERHHDRVPLIVITVLNNFACSSPVSMENIREVRRLANSYGIPLFIDACRMAENAYFIKTRENGYQDRSIVEIVREMLSHADACWMSAKKDALVNIGGFIATNDEALLRRCQELVVLYEGFHSYGGLARRDLEAMAQGLREGTDEDYLAHRIRLVAYLGQKLEDQGIVISQPVGGSGVFIDVEKLYPHLGPDQCPGIALFCDLYREGGIRGGGFPFTVNTVTPDTGEIIERVFQFARFAVARRVYSKSHMDYVAAIMGRVKQLAPENRGCRVVEKPERLSHFFAKFAPL
jgi:tryptophanase